MRLVVEFDDLHWKAPYENARQDVLRHARAFAQLGVKVTYFTPAFFDGKWIGEDEDFCDELIELEHAGLARIALHGEKHKPHEYDRSTIDECKASLLRARQALYDAGLNPGTAFRAPFWQLGHECLRALEDLGYTHVMQHPDRPLATTLRSYAHNWDLSPGMMPPESGLVIAHGHTHHRCNNGIAGAVGMIEAILRVDVTALFVDELP